MNELPGRSVSNPLYEHTQQGHFLRYAFGLCLLLVGGGFFSLGMIAEDAEFIGIGLLTGAVLMVVLLLFHSLTVQVFSEQIVLKFGIGLIRKRFAVRDIQQSSVVRNRWYYGWGIRFTPHGWLYNVSGLDAVEIVLQNGSKVRIGTDEPGALQRAVTTSLHARSISR